MTENFLSRITIRADGHLPRCDIQLSKKERQPLILTGRNGSGKTALLEAIHTLLLQQSSTASPEIELTFTAPEQWPAAQRGNTWILAYYPASYHLEMVLPTAAECAEFPYEHAAWPVGADHAGTDHTPGRFFPWYLATIHTQKRTARENNDRATADQLGAWLTLVDQAVQDLFQDSSLTLEYTPQSSVCMLISQQYNRATALTELSDGQHRILAMFFDLLMRMECVKAEEYDRPGIVLIDHLENHLHTDVQKRALPFLVNFFPKLQFIVSTHSPFVMNSLEAALVFNLDRQTHVNNVLTYPYEALIEHCDLSKYSNQIKLLLGEYESLLDKKVKTEDEDFRLLELGNYLAWVLNKFRQEREKNATR